MRPALRESDGFPVKILVVWMRGVRGSYGVGLGDLGVDRRDGDGVFECSCWVVPDCFPGGR